MPSRTAVPTAGGHGYASSILFGITALALIFRFCWVVLKYAVNLFFYDEWNAYASLFERQPLWHVFVAQHGPHRQGLGVVIVTKLLYFAHWDSRVQAFTIAAAIVLAMILATYLKIRAFGPISAWDIAIPLIFLGLGQWEALLGATGASPEAFPLLLIVAYCFAWIEGRGVIRNVAVLVINFLLIFTGFGVFIAGITLLLFGLEAYHGAKTHDRWRTKTPLLSLAIATASLASFLLWLSVRSVGSVLPLSVSRPRGLSRFLGTDVRQLSGCEAGRDARFDPRSGGHGCCEQPTGVAHSSPLEKLFCGPCEHVDCHLAWIQPDILGSYSRGPCLLGPGRCARYLTLLIPAFLGIYFSILAIPNEGKRVVLSGIFILVLLPSCVHRYHKEIEAFSALKQNWKQCYRAHEDIRFCDAEAHFQLYPCPECIQMKEKLEFLKRNRLNLYADSK